MHQVINLNHPTTTGPVPLSWMSIGRIARCTVQKSHYVDDSNIIRMQQQLLRARVLTTWMQ